MQTKDTFESLVKEYNEFIEKNKLESCSASELLQYEQFFGDQNSENYEKNIDYLEKFIERWEEMQERLFK